MLRDGYGREFCSLVTVASRLLIALITTCPYPASAQLYSNSSTGNVGVGTTSPTHRLDIRNSAGDANVTLSTALSTQNIAARYLLNTNAQAWGIGTAYNYNSNELFIADYTNLIEKIQIYPGSTGSVVLNPTGGSVGIGVTSPRGGSKLDVNGTIYVGTFAAGTSTAVCQNGNVLASCTSAQRFKENIEPSPLGLKEVLEMKPVVFSLRDHKENWEKYDFGFVAEDMEKINPVFVTYDNEDNILGVRYMQLGAVNTKAIQELHAIEKHDVAELKEEIERLKEAIAKLSNER